MDDDTQPNSDQISMANDSTHFIPCESLECQMEGKPTHDSAWIVRVSCCNDTEAWCQHRANRYIRNNLHDPEHATTGYPCVACGSIPKVIDWVLTTDLGNSPTTP